METDELRGLLNRTERLERRLRGYQTLCTLGVLGAVAWVSTGLASPEASHQDANGVVRARGLIIVDDEGRDRILLGAPVPQTAARTHPDATTSLVFLGEDGTDRVTVGYMPNPRIKGEIVPRISQGWGIQVNDDRGNERGGFSYLENGRMVLGIDFAETGEAITVAVVDGQYAAIMINDETGARERAGIYVGKDGPAVMKLGGPGGTRVMLKVPGDDDAQLLLVDPADNWSMVDVMPRPKP